MASCAAFIALFSPLTRAGDVYMWTDEEGVVQITDNPHRLPPGGDVERIRDRNRGDANGQSLPDKGQYIEAVTEKVEEEEAVRERTRETAEEEAHRRELEQKLEQAREEYALAKELVEKRRRQYSRKRTRPSRDQYRHALAEQAEKMKKLRELEKQK